MLLTGLGAQQCLKTEWRQSGALAFTELLRREGRVVVAFERFEQGVLRLEGLDPHLALAADVGVAARAASGLH